MSEKQHPSAPPSSPSPGEIKNVDIVSTNVPDFNTLVFSGGSTHAFSFLGCVRLLEDRGEIDRVKTVAGSSAGALIAFMIALGMDSHLMQKWSVDTLTEMRANELDIDDILDVYTSMGVDKGSRLLAFLGDLTQSRIERRDVTFAELERINPRGKQLVVCASNLTTSSPEYFDAVHTPDVSVLTALHASMCLPIFFAPVTIDGVMYADGGLFENLPVRGVLCKNDPSSLILALNVPWTTSAELPSDLVQYALYLVTSLLKRANHLTGTKCVPELTDEERKRVHVVNINEDELEQEGKSRPFLGFCVDSMEFVIDKPRVDSYVRHGYRVLKTRLEFLERERMNEIRQNV